MVDKWEREKNEKVSNKRGNERKRKSEKQELCGETGERQTRSQLPGANCGMAFPACS